MSWHRLEVSADKDELFVSVEDNFDGAEYSTWAALTLEDAVAFRDAVVACVDKMIEQA